jgi:hypothetical protein
VLHVVSVHGRAKIANALISALELSFWILENFDRYSIIQAKWGLKNSQVGDGVRLLSEMKCDNTSRDHIPLYLNWEQSSPRFSYFFINHTAVHTPAFFFRELPSSNVHLLPQTSGPNSPLSPESKRAPGIPSRAFPSSHQKAGA